MSLKRVHPLPPLSIPQHSLELPQILSKKEENEQKEAGTELPSERQPVYQSQLSSPPDSSPLPPSPTTKPSTGLVDIKLSQYLANNKHIHPSAPPLCTRCKFEPFYIYTVLVFAATIILAVSPRLGLLFIRAVIDYTAAVARLPQPSSTLLFAALLYAHQLLGIPLQSVTVMLIAFCTRSFPYSFLMALMVNLSSSALVFTLARQCCYRWLQSRYKDNVFVLVMRHEASLKPVKVAWTFRFMNIPGLYKNIGLILSEKIGFRWYFGPAVVESAISSSFLCILGSVMSHGIEVLDPKGISSKKKELRVVFILSYVFMAVQIGCIVAGIVFTLLRYRKMQRVKREVERRRWRESVKTKGYIHDVENHYATQTNEHDIPESLYSNPTHHDADCPITTQPKEDDKSTIEVYSPLGPKRDRIESSTSSRRSTHNGRTESNIPFFTQESTIVDRMDHNTQCDNPIEMTVPDKLLKELDDSNPGEDK